MLFLNPRNICPYAVTGLFHDKRQARYLKKCIYHKINGVQWEEYLQTCISGQFLVLNLVYFNALTSIKLSLIPTHQKGKQTTFFATAFKGDANRTVHRS